MILSSLIPPTTLTVTFGFFASYSATTFLNTSSSRALQPTQTVSFVACALPGARPTTTPRRARPSRRGLRARRRPPQRVSSGPPRDARADPRVPAPPTSVSNVRKLYESGRYDLSGHDVKPLGADQLRLVKIPTEMRPRPHSTVAALPPLLKHAERAHGARGDPLRRADLARGDLASRRHLEADRLARPRSRCVDAGLVREAAHEADGPSYGAVFFEPVPEAALVLGLDLGAPLPARRRSATSAGTCARARTSSSHGADAAARARRDRRAARTRSSTRPRSRRRAGRRRRRRRAGRRRRRAPGRSRSRRASPASRERRFAPTLERAPRARASGSRTTSTWRPSASSGRGSRAASTTSRSSRSAPASAPGSCCAASSTAAATARPARSTSRSSGSAHDVDPCAGAVAAFATRLAAERPRRRPRSRAPYDARDDLRRGARRRCSSPREVVAGGRAPDRAAHRPRRGGRRRRRSSSSAAASARTATCCWRRCGRSSTGGCRTRRASRSRSSARPPCSPARSRSASAHALDDVVERREPAVRA